MKSVALVEGWAGGPKLSRLFLDALKENKYAVTKKVEEADIIIAHSTGCYLLPSDTKAKLIILIDPPYWPGRSIIGRWIDLIKTDVSLLFQGTNFLAFLRNKFWEIFYIFAKPRFTWSVLRNDSKLEFLDQLKDKKLMLIRNEEDQFCSADIKGQLEAYKNVDYMEVPGDHENYYSHPQPYIDLIREEL